MAAVATLVVGTGLASCGDAPDQVTVGGLVPSTSTSSTSTSSTTTSSTSSTTTPPPGPLGTVHVTMPHTDRCDPLGDGCLLPFPSDFYTVADSTADTGRRLHLQAESLPANVNGVHVDPTHWNELDGFSPAAAILFQLPGLDLAATGAAPVTDPAASLAPDAPVVLLDASTRRRLPYWVELDAAAEPGSVPTAYIRPAVILPEGHRIVVAMRRLRTGDGSLLAPGEVFGAYRDGRRTDDPDVEARRPAMERIFADLRQARVERRDLVLAWDFTVASQRALSERLLHLRDDGFARLGTAAPAFTVTSDVASTRAGIAREITGTYQVPRYLSGTGAPGSEFVFGPDGLPTYTGTITAPFKCIIPTSATAANPAAAGLYGHGLLGTAGQVGAAAGPAAQGNRIFCGTDLIGMASEDIGNVIQIVQDVSRFNTLADRLQQGHLNTLFLGRLMIHPDGFGSNPSFQDHGHSLLTRDLAYYGLSQGGIMGGATTAVAQDWTRRPGRAGHELRAAPRPQRRLRQLPADPQPLVPVRRRPAIGLQLIQMLGTAASRAATSSTSPRTPTPTPRRTGCCCRWSRRPPGGQRGHRGGGPLHRRPGGPAGARTGPGARPHRLLGRGADHGVPLRRLGGGHVRQRLARPAHRQRAAPRRPRPALGPPGRPGRHQPDRGLRGHRRGHRRVRRRALHGRAALTPTDRQRSARERPPGAAARCATSR
ncbi:MAG: hypothetical protein R2746_08050 [Acidimicrobiales bacterium]